MSAAIIALIKQAIRKQRMSFSVVDENGFIPEEVRELRRRMSDIYQGRYEAHNLIED